MNKNVFCFAFAVCLFVPCLASTSPLYRETFKVCTALDTVSKNAMDLAGWKAFRSGSSVGKVGFLKLNSPGSPDHPLAYNSSPIGPDNGAAFWSKPVSRGLTVLTDEFSMDVANLELVQYQQRLGGYDITAKKADGSQLALLIGNTWYISEQTVRQNDKGVWETVSLAAHQLTYGTSVNISGKGPKKPGNYNVHLPSSGMITAFGVFVPRVNGRVRIDNFTLIDSAEDLHPAGEQGSAAQCDYSKPIDDGGSTGGDNSTNSGGGTGNTTEDPLKGRFCSGRSGRPRGRVVASSRVRKQIILSVTGKSLVAARDRAMLSLILFNKMRVDSLVNVTTADYYSAGPFQAINAAGVTKRPVKVSAVVKRRVDEYIAASGLPVSGAVPLFNRINRKTGKVSLSALCTGDVNRMVLKRAIAAGLRGRMRIKS